MGVKLKPINRTKTFDADIKFLCGAFSQKLLSIFSHNPEIILTTPAHRRQVWYAVLSAPNASDDIPNIADAFQFSKSQALIESAYGTMPSFMFTILKRIGVKPQPRDWYNHLHQILNGKPDIGHSLINCNDLVSTVDVFAVLPPELQCVNFARKFHKPARAKEFFEKFAHLCAIAKIENPKKYLELKIQAGCDPSTIIQSVYHSIRFQPPALKPGDGLTYLSTVKELKNASRAFNNCLMDRVDQAFCNAHQHYILTHGDEEIVFSIQKLADNSWQFYEAEDKTSLFVCGEIEEKMKSILQANGVSLVDRLSMLVA